MFLCAGRVVAIEAEDQARIEKGQDVRSGEVVGEIIDTDRLQMVASIFPPGAITRGNIV